MTDEIATSVKISWRDRRYVIMHMIGLRASRRQMDREVCSDTYRHGIRRRHVRGKITSMSYIW